MKNLKKCLRMPLLLSLFFWGTGVLSAQLELPTLNMEKQLSIADELVLIPDANRGKQFYFLPKQLKVKTNQEEQYMFSLLKFVGAESSGTLLTAHFTFEPELAKSYDLQEMLVSSYPDSYYAGPYPFYRHEQFSGQFENIDLIMELVNGSEREEIWRHKAALTTTGMVISAKLPDEQSVFLWESLAGGVNQSIEFKIEVALKTIEYLDDLQLIFNPQELKDYLVNPLDSTQINQERFSQIIESLLENKETALIEVKGDAGLYEEEVLTQMILDKVAEQLFENANKGEKTSIFNYSSSSKTTTRRVIVNGEIVEENSSSDTEEGREPSTSKTNKKFKQNQDLSDSCQVHFLGKKAVGIQTYPLRLNLTDFYRQHAKE